jgi:hypothetical protein
MHQIGWNLFCLLFSIVACLVDILAIGDMIWIRVMDGVAAKDGLAFFFIVTFALMLLVCEIFLPSTPHVRGLAMLESFLGRGILYVLLGAIFIIIGADSVEHQPLLLATVVGACMIGIGVTASVIGVSTCGKRTPMGLCRIIPLFCGKNVSTEDPLLGI